MSHTIHKRLQAAHSHDNEEMAQNGAIWRKYNKRKPCRFSNLPCAKCPGRSHELYDNEKNATECNRMNKFSKNPWLDRPSPLPAPRPTRRRGNPCGCPSPLLNGETGNRRSIHALPKFDKQERMYHTIRKRLQAAHSHDNEEMAQNGAIWRKYNKRKPCRFSDLPCARCPGRSRELYDNGENATECNTMQQIFKKSWAGRALTFPSTPTNPVITQKLPPANPS